MGREKACVNVQISFFLWVIGIDIIKTSKCPRPLPGDWCPNLHSCTFLVGNKIIYKITSFNCSSWKKFTPRSFHHQCHHRSHSAIMDETRAESTTTNWFPCKKMKLDPCKTLPLCCSHLNMKKVRETHMRAPGPNGRPAALASNFDKCNSSFLKCTRLPRRSNLPCRNAEDCRDWM